MELDPRLKQIGYIDLSDVYLNDFKKLSSNEMKKIINKALKQPNDKSYLSNSLTKYYDEKIKKEFIL